MRSWVAPTTTGSTVSMAAAPGNLRVKIEPGQVTVRLGDDIAYFPETMSDVDTAYFRSVYACRILFA